MKNSIQASIVVSTRHRQKDLEDFLSSLKNTGHLDRNDVEVIIVDNSDGDKATKNVCDKFGVSYFRQTTRGKSKSLNFGMGKSIGQYLIFTDDDVIIDDKRWVDKFIAGFADNPSLGYLSGDVIALDLDNKIQSLWENKGGLSKGKGWRYWDNKKIVDSKKVWPLTQFCVGANCAIPKSVFERTGPYCELLGPGGLIGHGESIEIGYRIIRAGYDVAYNPSIYLYHKHPSSERDLKKKLFLYGIGDTALHMHIFLKFKDWRSLRWSLYGHPTYSLKKIWKRVFGKYNLPISYIIYSLGGSVLGSWLYLYKRTHAFLFR